MVWFGAVWWGFGGPVGVFLILADLAYQGLFAQSGAHISAVGANLVGPQSSILLAYTRSTRG